MRQEESRRPEPEQPHVPLSPPPGPTAPLHEDPPVPPHLTGGVDVPGDEPGMQEALSTPFFLSLYSADDEDDDDERAVFATSGEIVGLSLYMLFSYCTVFKEGRIM